MVNNFVPQTLGIFAWRVVRGRIPVRLELEKRGNDLNSVRCPVCDNALEYVDHIILDCNLSKDTWNRICRWWGFPSFNNPKIDAVFRLDNGNLFSSEGQKAWQAVKWVCGYLLGKNRNQIFFHNKFKTSADVFNDIQIKSFEWISRRARKLSIEWHQWLLNPGFYLDTNLQRTGIG
ncbi:uncharacterized protein [Rutidosis leptorrhynchoides]|uniref:uncharacterized protein n=1 Tax=Rutidosis leptorrhynchoides TaxID=125765 RepID=UPI003A998FC4